MTSQAATSDAVVFLLDVDNTLLDNAQVTADLKGFLTREVGTRCQERYWAIFEELRRELGYADYPGALQRYGFWSTSTRSNSSTTSSSGIRHRTTCESTVAAVDLPDSEDAPSGNVVRP